MRNVIESNKGKDTSSNQKSLAGTLTGARSLVGMPKVKQINKRLQKMSTIIVTSSEIIKLMKDIYETSVEHGFHDEEHSVEHCLGLVLSEIGEAINADRDPKAPKPTKETIAKAIELTKESDKQHNAFNNYFKKHIKGSVVEELADVAIRLMDTAASMAIVFSKHSNLEENNIPTIATLPDQLFGFSIYLDTLTYDFADGEDYAEALQYITNITKNYTHLDLWQVVRLKMLYNKTRPQKNGKAY